MAACFAARARAAGVGLPSRAEAIVTFWFGDGGGAFPLRQVRLSLSLA
jgi:hypothetical protein